MTNTTWSNWIIMPSPDSCRKIEAPRGSGIYQIRNRVTMQNIQFGIGVGCQKRMKSLFPKPHGVGTRNNENKRVYILTNWKDLQYRTFATDSRAEAKLMEDSIKAQNNHLFNT